MSDRIAGMMANHPRLQSVRMPRAEAEALVAEERRLRRVERDLRIALAVIAREAADRDRKADAKLQAGESFLLDHGNAAGLAFALGALGQTARRIGVEPTEAAVVAANLDVTGGTVVKGD